MKKDLKYVLYAHFGVGAFFPPQTVEDQMLSGEPTDENHPHQKYH